MYWYLVYVSQVSAKSDKNQLSKLTFSKFINSNFPPNLSFSFLLHLHFFGSFCPISFKLYRIMYGHKTSAKFDSGPIPIIGLAYRGRFVKILNVQSLSYYWLDFHEISSAGTSGESSLHMLRFFYLTRFSRSQRSNFKFWS